MVAGSQGVVVACSILLRGWGLARNPVADENKEKKVYKVNEITINYSHLRHYFIAIKNSAFEI